MSETKRIGMIGAGAIGGWLAAKLALAGHEVTLLRAPERLDGARRQLRYSEAGETHALDLPAASALPNADLIIIAVKAVHLATVAPLAARSIGPETLILPLQNGVPWWFMAGDTLSSVDPDGEIAAHLPAGQVIGAVVHAAARMEGPDHIALNMADRLLLGEPWGGTSERVGALAALFRDADVPGKEDPDIRRAIWYKLWGNLTMNPLSALTGATMDKLLDEAALKGFVLDCMAECAAVGGAIGCPITESGEDRMEVARRLGAFKTSMLQDVETGRPIELEALVGSAREIAVKKGIATPNIDALYGMARLFAEGRGLI